jgi:predicted acyltransferase
VTGSGTPRLTSLDVFRGATMAAMVIVNTPGDWGAAYAPLLHAEWNGWTPTDLIFPFFVFIVGVSITLSRRRAASVPVIARRAAVLYGLGLLLALYPRFDFGIVRIMGVLPRLAVCYLAAALVYRALSARDDRTRLSVSIVVAGGLLAGYWALMRFVPAPGGVAGDLTPSGNLGAWIDRTVLGEAHLWRQSKTWDPEGLLSTLPAIATALTGIAAGVVLTGARPAGSKTATLVAAGAAGTALGLAWNLEFPINKNLWTSSYVLFTSGLASMLLAACYWAIDVRGWRGWTRPFVVMGTNALALFVFSGWLVKTLLLVHAPLADGTSTTLYHAIYARAFQPFASPKLASLAFALAALAGMYVLLELLYRRRWFLKA